MLLILLLVNNDKIYQISDRRITYINKNKENEEDYNKALVYSSKDARFTLGMVGFAKIDESINWL